MEEAFDKRIATNPYSNSGLARYRTHGLRSTFRLLQAGKSYILQYCIAYKFQSSNCTQCKSGNVSLDLL